MKKILASLITLAITFSFLPASAGAASPAPARQDILVMKHDLFTLWVTGFSSPRQMDEGELLQASLRFILHGQSSESVESLEEHPARFTNLPSEYGLFVSAKDVENVARRVFNGFIGKSLPPGVFRGSEGYYINQPVFDEFAPVDDDARLPGYCTVESTMQQPNGILILNGKVRRFKQNIDSGQEILWASAPFMARFIFEDGRWVLTTFIFTEEAMG